MSQNSCSNDVTMCLVADSFFFFEDREMEFVVVVLCLLFLILTCLLFFDPHLFAVF